MKRTMQQAKQQKKIAKQKEAKGNKRKIIFL